MLLQDLLELYCKTNTCTIFVGEGTSSIFVFGSFGRFLCFSGAFVGALRGHSTIPSLFPCPREQMEVDSVLGWSLRTSRNQYKGRWREKHWHVYSWFIESFYIPERVFSFVLSLASKARFTGFVWDLGHQTKRIRSSVLEKLGIAFCGFLVRVLNKLYLLVWLIY